MHSRAGTASPRDLHQIRGKVATGPGVLIIVGKNVVVMEQEADAWRSDKKGGHSSQ